MKSPLTTEIEPATFLFVAQHLNHCATVVPHLSRLHKPSAILSCFQEGAPYSPTWGFNNLPRSITSLRNENLQVKLALKNFYFVYTPFTRWMNFLHVQTTCVTDLYDCVNPYTVIILCVLYVFDMFHILLSGDRLKDLRCLCECVCVCVCVCVG